MPQGGVDRSPGQIQRYYPQAGSGTLQFFQSDVLGFNATMPGGTASQDWGSGVAIEPDGHRCIDQYIGSWGVSGPIYFTIVTETLRGHAIEATGSGSAGKNNAYAVLEIDDELFEYESFSSKTRIAARRVSDDFAPDDL